MKWLLFLFCAVAISPQAKAADEEIHLGNATFKNGGALYNDYRAKCSMQALHLQDVFEKAAQYDLNGGDQNAPAYQAQGTRVMLKKIKCVTDYASSKLGADFKIHKLNDKNDPEGKRFQKALDQVSDYLQKQPSPDIEKCMSAKVAAADIDRCITPRADGVDHLLDFFAVATFGGFETYPADATIKTVYETVEAKAKASLAKLEQAAASAPTQPKPVKSAQ